MVFSGTVRAFFSKLAYIKPHPFPLAEAFGVQVVLLRWATEHLGDDKALTCHCKTLKERT